MNAIKKVYREFSKKYHPDMGGDSKIFAQGSYLFKTSPARFLKFLDQIGFKYPPQLKGEIKGEIDFASLGKAVIILDNMLEKLVVKLNPARYDTIDDLIKSYIRILKLRHRDIFRYVSNEIKGIHLKNAVFSRMVEIVNKSIDISWYNFRLNARKMYRHILYPESAVQYVRRNQLVPDEIRYRVIAELVESIKEDINESNAENK